MVLKIAFTGGPCGGKSTYINKLKEDLKEDGFEVIVVSETATELIDTIINGEFLNSTINFQDIILKDQIFKENIVDDIIKLRENEKIIVLYDRGILDNKAYLENYQDFDFIMKKQNMKELEVLDNYDIVFDLLSTAVCAPEKYTTKNNVKRKEEPEEARKLDFKTSNAWVGHRNFYELSSAYSEAKVYDALKSKIYEYIYGKVEDIYSSYETKLNFEDIKTLDDNNSRLINVEEIALNTDNKEYIIIKRTYKKHTTYILNVSKKEDNKKTTYYDKKISYQEYLELLMKYGIKNMEKYKLLSFRNDMDFLNLKAYNDRIIYERKNNILEKNKSNKQKSLSKTKKHGSI